MQPRDDRRSRTSERAAEPYRCGLRAGDRVELRKPLAIRDHAGRPTGEVIAAGAVWTVLPGSVNDPGVVWFRCADDERHTWDDDATEIAEWFTRLGPPT